MEDKILIKSLRELKGNSC